MLLETLSIVAYKQPVTKLEIEKIRGVKSDHAVNKLVEYGLIEEVGRLDAPGRPILFGTTEEFPAKLRRQLRGGACPRHLRSSWRTIREEAEEELGQKLPDPESPGGSGPGHCDSGAGVGCPENPAASRSRENE